MGLRNQNGFMLVQVLVAAGIMALIGMVMASVMSDMWKQSSSLQAKQNEMTFSDAVRQRLSTSALCRANLVNKTNFDPTVSRSLEVLIQDGAPAVKTGSRPPHWNLEVERLDVQNINTAVTSIQGSTVYAGEVHFQGTSLTGSQMKYRNKSLGTIFLKVQDSSRTIVDCYFAESSDNLMENACRSMGGVMVGKTCDLSAVKSDMAKEICIEIKGTWKNGKCDVSSLFASMGSCPAGQAASGFTADGQLICRKAEGGRMCELSLGSNPPLYDTKWAKAPTCCNAGETSKCFMLESHSQTSPGGNTTSSSRRLCQCF